MPRINERERMGEAAEKIRLFEETLDKGELYIREVEGRIPLLCKEGDGSSIHYIHSVMSGCIEDTLLEILSSSEKNEDGSLNDTYTKLTARAERLYKAASNLAIEIQIKRNPGYIV